jgi:hypothetical protein
MKILFVLLLALPLSAESLRYTINWPSGLSVGEITLRSDVMRDPAADKSAEHWAFDADVDAGFPGFPVRDHAHSTATPGLCSVQLDKKLLHGMRASEERITFDLAHHTALREPKTGGKSEVQVTPCARDPLAFLQFIRKELAMGRLAPRQQVVFGANYEIRLTFSGTESLQVENEKLEVEHLVAALKGPASEKTFDVYFARDAGRTPVRAKVPTPLGIFTVELVR